VFYLFPLRECDADGLGRRGNAIESRALGYTLGYVMLTD
jgi:hypothetical protein